MSHRRMTFSSLSLPAFLFAAAIAPAGAVVIGNTSYSLTFPDGWSDLTQVKTTNQVLAIKGTYGELGNVSLNLYPNSGLWTESQITLFMTSFTKAAAESLEVGAEETKTFGGKEFHMVEYMKTGTSDSVYVDSRYRLYLAPVDGSLFMAFTHYDAPDSTDEVGDIESALATLQITASAALRPAAAPGMPQSASPAHDALGRFKRIGMAKTPWFRAPTR